MKRLNLIFALTMLAALAASPVMATGVPSTINLQGRFTDAAGNNVADGVYPAVFSIYDDQIAGTLHWSDTLPVQVSGGLFTVLVGTDTPIPANIFSRFANLYLGITVTPEPELPRVPLSSVAYAFQGQYAEDAVLAHDLTCLVCVSASEVDPTQIQLRVAGTASAGQYITGINQDGSVTTALDANNAYTAGTGLTLGGNQFSISPNGVTSTEIAPSAVLGGLAGDIADGTITHDDLGTGSVNANEIGIGAVNSSGVLDNSLLAADIAAGAVVGGLGGDIADGTLTHDDLGTGSVNANEIGIGAVNSSGVLDNSLLAVDIDDEPGVASDTGATNALLYLDGTVQTLISRVINAPAAGYVLVIATAQVEIDHANNLASEAAFGVSTNAGVMPANQDVEVQIPYTAPTGSYLQVATVHGLFSTNGGVDNFFFLADRSFGDFYVADLQLTLIYFPTAHGTVVETGAAPAGGELSSDESVSEVGDRPDSEQAGESPRQGANSATFALDQTQVIADLQARVQMLEEHLRATETKPEEKR